MGTNETKPFERQPHASISGEGTSSPPRKHNHYFKPVPAGVTHVDVYRVLSMFNVTDPCLQHAIKKLLVAGGRGAGKNIEVDVKEAIDSLKRKLEMIDEDAKTSN